MKQITKKQREVLIFIKKYLATHGYPPAIREIGSGLNLASPATVQMHVQKLEALGYIKKTSSKFRTIEIVGENEYLKSNDDLVKVPLLGKITAGNPIEAIEMPNEFFTVPAALIPKGAEVFTLHVVGESMIQKGIYDDDYVIIRKQATAHNGDLVVAMTPDNEVTLKTFYKEKNRIRLQPANDQMQPLFFPEVQILGIAIGLYRKF